MPILTLILSSNNRMGLSNDCRVLGMVSQDFPIYHCLCTISALQKGQVLLQTCSIAQKGPMSIPKGGSGFLLHLQVHGE